MISRPKQSEKHRFGGFTGHIAVTSETFQTVSRESPISCTRVNGLLGTRLGAFPLLSIEHPPRLESGLIELDRRCKNGDSNRLTVDVLKDDEPDLVDLAQFVSADSSVAR
jgi:hypothetical protein